MSRTTTGPPAACDPNHHLQLAEAIWADGGYAGQLESEVANLSRHRQIDLEIVKHSDGVKGFKVLPKRWIVKQTFGWLIQSRA